MAPPVPLLALRFAPRADGTWQDLATGATALLIRRAATEVAAAAWPEQAARLWHLWHPHLASALDFGWVTDDEWFDAYAIVPVRSGSGGALDVRAVVDALLASERITCGIELHPALGGAAMPVPDASRAGNPGARTQTLSPARVAAFGMQLVTRAIEGRLLACLDEPLGVGPRVWRVDAPPGCGWRTSWRRLAREARLRGFAPVSAPMLDACGVDRQGRPASWLSLLGGHRLLVLRETPAWVVSERQALARLLVRLGGADSPAIVLLDVVRDRRPAQGEFAVDPIEPDALADAVRLPQGRELEWVPAAAARAGHGGAPGAFVSEVARLAAMPRRPPMVHERHPSFATSAGGSVRLPGRGLDAGPEQAVVRAQALVARGRTAAAMRVVRRAAGTAGRRGRDGEQARLLVEAARLAARRGDLPHSARCWDAALRAAPGPSLPLLVEPGRLLAAEWMRQAALREAERLLRALRASIAAMGSPGRPAIDDGLLHDLVACLCWQERPVDALGESDASADAPVIRVARVWARLAVHDLDGAARDLAAAERSAAGDAALAIRLCAARLRLDVATGRLDRLHAALHGIGPDDVDAEPAVADDLRLLPMEGLVRHGAPLPGVARDRARTLGRRGQPGLVRARARLVLALDAARGADPAALPTELARVVSVTGAQALGPGAALSPWPPPRKETAIMLDEIVALLRICQECEAPRDALEKAAIRLRDHFGASAVLVAGPGADTPALAGAGQGDLRAIARRAMELRQSVRPSPAEPACAVPVIMADEVIGALAIGWRLPDARPPSPLVGWMEAAATALAPHVRLAIELREPAVPPGLESALLGISPAIEALRRAVAAAARVPFTVLVEGESGSGKELVAREVHRLGPRRGRAFCAINCAALTDELCEAELFGHARGAFTGAVGERAGLFEEADGGTLFLDEVSELSPRAQAKLLRAIQEGEVRRLGETRPRRVEVRIVAATNRPLADAAAAGVFRTDLRYRLDVVHIDVPPLRDRPDDIPLLARHFWLRALERVDSRATLSRPLVECLARYRWPGNVRELQNVLAALAVHAPRRGVVGPAALPPGVRAPNAVGGETLEEARRRADAQAIRAALARAGGHRGRAAEALGLSRQGLAKLVGRLQIDVTDPRAVPRR